MKIQLKRAGCTQYLFANLEPCPHGSTWRLDVEPKSPAYWVAIMRYPNCSACFGQRSGTVAWKGNRTTQEDVTIEAAAAIPSLLNKTVEISPFIEAGFCYTDRDITMWPWIKDDMFITSAIYDPQAKAIRYIPSGEKLLGFDQKDPAILYGTQFGREKYPIEIKQVSVDYHRRDRITDEILGGPEQPRMRCAFLLGQWIRHLPGEHPITTNSMSQVLEESIINSY